MTLDEQYEAQMREILLESMTTNKKFLTLEMASQGLAAYTRTVERRAREEAEATIWRETARRKTS